MLKGKISPSMMCANHLDLKADLQAFERLGIEYLHFDIMDGIFVPNLMLNNEMMKAIRTYTKIPFDVHMMIVDPERKINWFDLQKGDIVSVHYESTPHVHRAIQQIKATGASASIALNPATPINAIKYLLPDIDMVLVMTVNPGFAGQKLVTQCLEKIKETRKFLDEAGYENISIQADGNCSFENCKLMRLEGADCFVAGTSSIFTKSLSMTDAVKKLREAIN